MRTPLFSVIIPTFERACFLSSAVESVLQQDESDLEVVIVDDASSIPVSLNAFADPRVRVVRRETNGGPAAARNTGWQAARGKHLAFLDDDDVWSRERLSVGRRGLQRALVSLCWSGYMGEDRERIGRLLEGPIADVILNGMTPHLGATVVHRGAMIPFDERFDACEDVEWWLRLGRGVAVATEPVVCTWIRRHDGPRDRTGPENRIRCGELLLKLHGDYFDSHRQAAAFRLMRMGLTALAMDQTELARDYLTRAIKARPSFRAAAHLIRVSCGRAGRFRGGAVGGA
jgi:glycosyltransferase involved in cell wall biosynthesis